MQSPPEAPFQENDRFRITLLFCKAVSIAGFLGGEFYVIFQTIWSSAASEASLLQRLAMPGREPTQGPETPCTAGW